MKAHYKKTLKPHTSYQHLASDKNVDADCEEELNLVAGELVGLARKRLPDRVLGGILIGLEDEIRQDAILLALGWYIRQGTKSPVRPKYPWLAPRAIAAALKIQKRDYLKQRKRELNAMKSIAEDKATTVIHPALRHARDWPSPAMRTMVGEAIRVALKSGRISHANASIALEVFANQTPVRTMAERLKVHRSSIHQHLSRVRREIPDIIDGIEVPLHQLM
jgi:DNA-directed RNA polymerase specialized sigma24 family protein